MEPSLNSPAVKQSQVFNELNQLDIKVDMVVTAAQELLKRIEPVTHSYPTAPDTASPKEMQGEPRVPVALRIYNAIVYLDNLQGDLQRAIANVEL